jgi:2-keto-4-pentenoate hydratase/2-oxohepta-3-ene-1,7-dioic acid hydratase in catechol pathway
MFLDVNGTRRQTGNTATMIFSVKHLIAYMSQFIRLFPDDLLITGTPPGVGEGPKPSHILLKAGDTMRLGFAGLGEQHQTMIGGRAGAEGVSHVVR